MKSYCKECNKSTDTADLFCAICGSVKDSNNDAEAFLTLAFVGVGIAFIIGLIIGWLFI